MISFIWPSKVVENQLQTKQKIKNQIKMEKCLAQLDQKLKKINLRQEKLNRNIQKKKERK